MDQFDEFARAIAKDNPDKYTVTDTNTKINSECELCSETGPLTEVATMWLCWKCHKKLEVEKGEKKSRKEELEEYENDYLRRLEITPEEVEKARVEIEITDDPKQKKKQRDVEVNRTKPRKVSDIHILTREEVEKARAEIEIIKIREPDRKSQKTIPTQATILSAGITLDDCYVILGVDQFITCDELKDQFRKLSVKYNSSIGMLSRTKEENEMIGKVHTRINQAYTELDKAHKCGG